MKYHVHIYRVIAKAEVDVEAESPEEARCEALKREDLCFWHSDCQFISIDFPTEDVTADLPIEEKEL